ncbi:MAG: photosynthetic complex putative assembly protein PuhB [Sphingomonadaceae bacterium]
MEHEEEPVRGLPGRLPPGEHILWQGCPDWRLFARTALPLRALAVYFALLIGWSLAAGSPYGAAATFVAGLALFGLMLLFAWGVGRSTVYTLTDKRIVLRIGIALAKCVNLPLALIAAADLRRHGDRGGDILLTLNEGERVGYALLWPHVRPWRLARPQPMLRALPDAEALAQLLSRAAAEYLSERDGNGEAVARRRPAAAMEAAA